jgi:thiamine-phosphate diphosphorylase
VQIRAKRLASGAFLDLVTGLVPQARAAGATLLVNDRVDVARAAGVGEDLGQEDLPVAGARRVLGPAAVIGRSTHTADELAAALAEPVTYVAYGPIFTTRTKANPDPVTGLEGLRAAAATARAAGLPLVAIGGITIATARAVTAAGATAVAVISDLVVMGEDPEARARRFLTALSANPV